MATKCRFRNFRMSLTTTRHYIRLLSLSVAALIIFLSFSEEAEAQTCRVSAGCTADGCQTYKEVFEFDYVDVKPQFPGGNEALLSFINKTRHYPKDAYEKGVEGRVTCSFVVNADGNISHLKVLKGADKSLNLEAMRILAEMPNWQPGRHQGKAVPVRVIHCIPFRR